MDKSFRKKVLEGDRLIGTMLTIGHQAVAESLSEIGFDWLFVETEHAPILPDCLHSIVLAAGPTPCLVRLSRNDEVSIKRALDAGAAGIIAPKVNSVETTERVVKFAKFPPEGIRGVGVSRASKYGLNLQNYVRSANDGITVVLQVEDYEAVENLEEIVAVRGVDAIFIGPYDLSASIGRTGDLAHPEVQELIMAAKTICANKRMSVGIFESQAANVDKWTKEGFSLFAVSTDISCLINEGKSLLELISL